MPLVHGADISAYQTITSWTQLRAALGFLIVKATERASYTSTTWTRYTATARSLGMLVGSYHFAGDSRKNPGDPTALGDPQAEADNYARALRLAGFATGTWLPPALDLERHAGKTRTALSAWATTFTTEVDRQLALTQLPRWQRCGLYVNPDYLRNHLTAGLTDDRWLWEAVWPTRGAVWPDDETAIPAGASMWQWTDQAKVPGILGDVDGDIARRADLQRLAPAYYQNRQETDMALTPADAKVLFGTPGIIPNRNTPGGPITNLATAGGTLSNIEATQDVMNHNLAAVLATVGGLKGSLDALTTAVAANSSVDADTLVAAVRAASEEGAQAALAAAIKVDVSFENKT